MYIRKTTQKNPLNGKTYYTYKLVQGYRDHAGKAKQAMLLNLGTEFNVTEDKWKLLTDRIEQLLSNQAELFTIELPKSIETMAQKLVKQIIRKRNQDQTFLKKRETTQAPVVDYQTVDVNSTEDHDVRFIGGEHISYCAIEQLKLPEILKELKFNPKQINIAIATIIARLLKPGSELSAHQYLSCDSAIDEILKTEFGNLQLKRLYLISDQLLKYKDAIESSLYAKEQELFQLTEVITLFDITNTYFEGHPVHQKAHLGRSKEKRSDCQLISLGILLDGSGFPKKSKILPGNISEPGTLKDMLSGMDSSATVIMDAGIATKDNILWLKENNYTYIVVRRDANLTMPEVNHAVVKDTLHNKVTVSLVKETESEVSLYCHSTAKEAQVKVFTNKMISRFEEELIKLNSGLKFCDLQLSEKYITESTAIILDNGDVYTNNAANVPINMLIKNDRKLTSLDLSGFSKNEQLTGVMRNNNDILNSCNSWNGQVRLKSKLANQLRKIFIDFIAHDPKRTSRGYAQVLQKIGRLKEQYKSVAYMYDITVTADLDKHNAQSIEFVKKEDQVKNKQAGVYCLSSNRTDLPAELLWNTYTMLTDLESAFKSLKSELGLRPVYHQLEHRIDGHIFISVLAYHVLHTIRYQLKQQGIHYSWDSIRKILSTQVRVTTSQNLKDGGLVKIRKTSRVTPDQAEIYNAMSISANPLGLAKTYLRK